MNILHICSPHLSDVASSHFNLGNPKKSFFQQYHSYILQIYLFSEENKLQLLHCSLAVYFTVCVLSAYPYYRVWGTLHEDRMYRVPVRDTGKLRQRLLRHGLISAQRGV